MSDSISRLNYTRAVFVTDAAGRRTAQPYYETRPRLRFRDLSGLRLKTPSGQDNWSRLSWLSMKNGRHWWIIADLSGVVDAFSDLHREPTTVFVGRLAANVSAGDTTAVGMDTTRRVRRGDVLTIRDVATGNTATVVVSAVTSTQIRFSSTTLPAFTAVNSQVLRVAKNPPKLLLPGSQQAFLRALDFEDAFNILEPV